MKLSKEDIDAKIVELYKSGCSFRQLQKRYHKSPNYIAKLVKGIEVTCTACGKPKGKVRFHAHHPDRVNQTDYTIPLCPPCHAREETRLRKEKQNQSRTPAIIIPNLAKGGRPSTALPVYPTPPLSKIEKKVIAGMLITGGSVGTLPEPGKGHTTPLAATYRLWWKGNIAIRQATKQCAIPYHGKLSVTH